jgi:hypothetical protein
MRGLNFERWEQAGDGEQEQTAACGELEDEEGGGGGARARHAVQGQRAVYEFVD